MSSSPTKLAWHRSKHCSNGACIEIASDSDTVFVRDSKNPSQPALAFTVEEWDAFVSGIRDGSLTPYS